MVLGRNLANGSHRIPNIITFTALLRQIFNFLAKRQIRITISKKKEKVPKTKKNREKNVVQIERWDFTNFSTIKFPENSVKTHDSNNHHLHTKQKSVEMRFHELFSKVRYFHHHQWNNWNIFAYLFLKMSQF